MKDNIKSFLRAVKADPKKKKVAVVFLIALILMAGGWLLVTKVFKPAPKQMYEAAIMVRDQGGGGNDKAGSLRKGDVLAVRDQGHNWSRTERISYLILDMELTKEQKRKLTRPKTRQLSEKEALDKELVRREELEGENALEGRELDERLQETVLARKYYIDFSELPKDFKPVDLIKGQPFKEQVFDWGIVEKKTEEHGF